MPAAMFAIISGIQVCISTSGPLSGTEKCRYDRIVFATPPIAPEMPEIMLLTISAPHWSASLASPVMKFFAPLNPSSMV